MADITFLQILDTSIKIGLGALISGAATYWVTKLNHERDIEKNTIRRKQEIVEQVVAEFEDYWNSRIELYAQTTVLISHSPIASTAPWQKQYKLYIDESAEKTKKTFHVESLLLLFGEQKTADLITKIRSMGSDVTTIALQAIHNNDKGPETTVENQKLLEILKENRNKITKERNNFYIELRSAYTRMRA